MASVRVLVVDDEPRLADAVRRALEDRGVGAEVAPDGLRGYARGRDPTFDVIVLDIMVPGMHGYEVCRRLRRDGVTTPILMLSAKDGEYDEVDALDLGADDYLRKPFATVVLIARVFALARRGNGAGRTAELRVDDLVLHEGRRQVFRQGRAVDLTPREFTLLHELMRHQGETLRKQDLLDRVWGSDAWGRDPNVVEVYIGYLRRKIDAPFGSRLIQTVRGQGYRISCDD